MATDPDLRDRLAGDVGVVPRAIEEVVRLHTPLHGFFRQTTCDIEVAGVNIPAGSEVMLSYAYMIDRLEVAFTAN
ncbi:MAG: cytochrome P450 [Candidatus Dormibacteria bacterium]